MCAPNESESDSGESHNRRVPSDRRSADTVLLINRQRAARRDWNRLRAFLDQVRPVATGRPFSVCLVSDRSIRRYNKKFRGRNEATDVLSFAADGGRRSSGYLGDIVISVETANRNAAKYGLSLEEEIQILVLHGVLHLMGYNHETDRGQMARAETRWCARLGLPANLTARSRRGRRTSQAVRR
jgi:probable rRNA maturation factor